MSEALDDGARSGDRGIEGGSILLTNGHEARIVPLADGWALEVDGFRQSHVGRADEPSPHATVRWMLAGLTHVLDTAPTPRVAHLGGAAMSLPRQVVHHRPDARQVVVELEQAMVDLVVEHAPPPPGIEVVVGDGRAWLERAAQVAPGSLQAIAIDVYAGGRIPPAFTSLDCARSARAALADHGVLVVNGVAGPELDFTRRHLAGLVATFEHVAMIVQGSALAGARFGNAVLVASAAPLDADGMRAQLRGDASRGALVTDLGDIVGHAEPMRDAEALWSPQPPQTAFVRRPDREG